MTLQIATANRLIDGTVVYLTAGNSWSPWIAESRIVSDEADAEAVLAHGHAAVARNEIVDPYLIDVVQEAATIKPIRYREIIRAKGPSTQPQEARLSTGPMPVGAVAAGATVAMAFLNGV